MRRRKIKRIIIFVCAAVIAVVLGRAMMKSEPEKTAHTEWGERRTVDVYVEEDKKIVSMDFEDYIMHVVAGEMPASYESSALSAQTVAARTYTLYKMGCARTGADICTNSACCQTFASENALLEKWGGDYDKYMDKIKEAADATDGKILVYDGKPIEALYHASSGGRTESAKNAYGNAREYLISVSSPETETLTKYSISKAEAAEIIKEKYKNSGVTQKNIADEFEIVSRNDSGRANEVRIGKETISGKELRALFSLRSTDISLRFTKEDVIFETHGYGHGVGMSQDGAQAMAVAGAGFEEILLHYYPKTSLEMY